MHRYVIFELFLFILLHSGIVGQDLVQIKEQRSYELVSEIYEVPAETKDDKINFDSIRQYSLIDRDSIRSENSYWLFNKAINNSTTLNWVIIVPFQTTTHGELYYQYESDEIKGPFKLGIFENRLQNDAYLSLGDKFIYQPITIPADRSITIALKLSNEKKGLSIDPFLKLMPFDKLFLSRQKSIAVQSAIFFGWLSIIIFLAFICYRATGDKSYSLYGLYLLSVLIWASFSNGLLRDWCFNHLVFIDPKYIFLLRSFGITSFAYYIAFIIEFGNLTRYYPKLAILRRLIIPAGWTLFLIDWSSLIFTNFNFVVSNLVEMMSMIAWLIFNVLILPLVWSTRREPYIQLIFWSLIVLCITVSITLLHLIFNNFESINAIEIFIGIVIEVGLFSFGLSLKFADHLRLQTENHTIKTLLKEKETLLKEIHHRVKNNMQVISSLLRIQTNQTTDEGALLALKEGQSRVQSMSLIHQDLYQHDNLTGIHMKDYVDKLAKSLLQTYQLSPEQVSIYTEVDDITLDVDTVVPLGLIINELVTNALKYAFPNNRVGTINISLKDHQDSLLLKVKDDGAGISPEAQEKGFGSGLIKAFARKLEGALTIDSTNGTLVTLIIQDYQRVDSQN